MRNFLFLLSVIVLFSSCSLEEDGPLRLRGYAPVTSVNLPETFAFGQTYELEVSYQRKNACHDPAGISVTRGSISGDKRREIYIAGITIYSEADNTCEKPEENLTETSVFNITIDEAEPFTFFLWTGVEPSGENIYTIIEVPVETSAQENSDN